jgi:hypothetical protein
MPEHLDKAMTFIVVVFLSLWFTQMQDFPLVSPTILFYNSGVLKEQRVWYEMKSTENYL